MKPGLSGDSGPPVQTHQNESEGNNRPPLTTNPSAPRLFHLPFKAAGVQPDLHEHGAAGVQVASLDGDPRSSGQGPRGRLDAGEIRRLRRKTGQWAAQGPGREKNPKRTMWSPADHEGEGLGGDGFVVLVDAVSDAHLHLSLLHAVTRGVVQLTHDPEKQSRAEVSSATAAVQ